ncbi:hypothetical protein FE257_010248 [Aspergillus nanangensis]|uniref:DUF2293 domain-containing protein n=1 Tax=Aspergillus nanangensis TaxID=2582783 RepID=A0AAD4CJK1_ASPNN|nr:hypothetical protein FE257_010248 [Aspergillus nanangensis]
MAGRRQSRTRARLSPRSPRSPQPIASYSSRSSTRNSRRSRSSPFAGISKSRPAQTKFGKRAGTPSKILLLPPSSDPLERNCFERQPMPDGYVFVPRGDVYITRHCRVKTKESQRMVYLVYDKSGKRTSGIRVPSEIYDSVLVSAAETAGSRASAVQHRDQRELAQSRALLRTQFPLMPEPDLDQILSHAFHKGSGRVGRTTQKTDAQKASLAVEAHIRHTHTPYETMLDAGVDRVDARKAVWDSIKAIKSTWEGDVAEPMGQMTLGDQMDTT